MGPLVTTAGRLVLAEDRPGRDREPGVDAKRDRHRRDGSRKNIPASAPAEKASKVQAANAIPCVAEHRRVQHGQALLGEERLEEPAEQLTERSGATVIVTATMVSLATAHRARPNPWVQEYR